MLSGLHCAASALTAPVTEPLPLVVHCHWQPPSARAIHALCWQATEHLRVANPWTILRSTVPRQRPWGQFVGVSRTYWANSNNTTTNNNNNNDPNNNNNNNNNHSSNNKNNNNNNNNNNHSSNNKNNKNNKNNENNKNKNNNNNSNDNNNKNNNDNNNNNNCNNNSTNNNHDNNNNSTTNNNHNNNNNNNSNNNHIGPQTATAATSYRTKASACKAAWRAQQCEFTAFQNQASTTNKENM
ncbi:unnamed protein product [Polarella glacialis]|uniref:Uncharacterized protein n=1 Tax=Polarella glacialis TaxID=89957 RepID=A0A813D3A3_POLGL|nr:unnamed protein product [Polarella glacialis]